MIDATSSPSATNTAINSPELVSVLGAMPVWGQGKGRLGKYQVWLKGLILKSCNQSGGRSEGICQCKGLLLTCTCDVNTIGTKVHLIVAFRIVVYSRFTQDLI